MTCLMNLCLAGQTDFSAFGEVLETAFVAVVVGLNHHALYHFVLLDEEIPTVLTVVPY